jgi:hypothetical protein
MQHSCLVDQFLSNQYASWRQQSTMLHLQLGSHILVVTLAAWGWTYKLWMLHTPDKPQTTQLPLLAAEPIARPGCTPSAVTTPGTTCG